MTFKDWMCNETRKKYAKPITPEVIFFKNVRLVLKYRRIPMYKFEKSLGFCQGFLSKHALGNVKTYLDDAVLISDDLGVPIDKLLNPYFVEWAKENLKE